MKVLLLAVFVVVTSAAEGQRKTGRKNSVFLQTKTPEAVGDSPSSAPPTARSIGQEIAAETDGKSFGLYVQDPMQMAMMSSGLDSVNRKGFFVGAPGYGPGYGAVPPPYPGGYRSYGPPMPYAPILRPAFPPIADPIPPPPPPVAVAAPVGVYGAAPILPGVGYPPPGAYGPMGGYGVFGGAINGVFEPMNLPSGASSILGIVQSSFSCAGLPYGYYADIENRCKAYHVCNPSIMPDGSISMTHSSFMCGIGTVWDQSKLACVHIGTNIDCRSSEAFLFRNEEFGRIPVRGPIPTPIYK